MHTLSISGNAKKHKLTDIVDRESMFPYNHLKSVSIFRNRCITDFQNIIIIDYVFKHEWLQSSLADI